jgi:hypothetical protein
MTINDHTLDEYCRSIAEDIVRDADSEEQAMDWACEAADSTEWAIYYHKAHELCQNCNTESGEDFVSEFWADGPMTYDEMACRIAYGEIDTRVRLFVYDLWQEKEDYAEILAQAED